MDQPLDKKQINAKRLRALQRATIWIAPLVFALFTVKQFISPSIPRSELRTSLVTRGHMQASLSASGEVVPKHEEVITAEITGQVEEILAHVGQRVNKGDLILQLDTHSVKNELDALKEKIAVKDNLIKSKHLQTRKNCNEIQSKIQLLKLDLESRSARFNRLEILSKSGASAKQELLEAEINVKRIALEIQQLQTSLKDTLESHELEIAGITLEKSIFEKEKSEKIRLLKSAMVKAARPGIVTWMIEEEGSRVTPGELLARIADLTRFKVEARISDFYANQLSEGQRVHVRQAKNKQQGKIKTVLPTIEEGLVKLIVELDTPNATSLRANLRVDVEIITATINNTLMIKQGPFISGKGVHEVFVINGDKATRKQVEIGLANTDYFQIISGLIEGDEVIISNMNEYLSMNKITVN